MLEIRDPCPNVPLILLKNPIESFDHNLRDSLVFSQFTLSSIVNVDTVIDCGPLAIDYWLED